jgi:hypothetical protein
MLARKEMVEEELTRDSGSSGSRQISKRRGDHR